MTSVLKNFLFATAFTQALGPTQPRVQRVEGGESFSADKATGKVVKLTTHFNLVPRIRMRPVILTFSCSRNWLSTGHLPLSVSGYWHCGDVGCTVDALENLTVTPAGPHVDNIAYISTVSL
jgi:hypothetical protein